jgi:hypothetical protein
MPSKIFIEDIDGDGTLDANWMFLGGGKFDWWRVRAAPLKRGTPMTKLDMLNARRAEKFAALSALVARDLGYGELSHLSEEDRNHGWPSR